MYRSSGRLIRTGLKISAKDLSARHIDTLVEFVDDGNGGELLIEEIFDLVNPVGPQWGMPGEALSTRRRS